MKKLFNCRRWTPTIPSIRFVFVASGSKEVMLKRVAHQKHTVVIAIDCEEELLRSTVARAVRDTAVAFAVVRKR